MKEPKMPTPEEMAEQQKSRTLNDAELLKEGAEFIPEKGGRNLRLELTSEQIEGAMEEMQEYQRKMRLKEYLYSADNMMEQLNNMISGKKDKQTQMKEIAKQVEEIQDLKEKTESLGFEVEPMLKKLETLKQNIEQLQNEIKEIPFDLKRLELAKETLSYLQENGEKLQNLPEGELKEEIFQKFLEENQNFDSKSEKKAKEMYLKAAEKAENDQNYRWAGDYYKKVGNGTKAEEMYLKAAEKEENNQNYGLAGDYYKEIGDETKAKEMYLKEAEEAENDQNYGLAGYYYKKIGNETKAKEMYLKEAKRAEDNDFLRYDLIAGYYEKVSEIDKSQKIDEILEYLRKNLKE